MKKISFLFALLCASVMLHAELVPVVEKVAEAKGVLTSAAVNRGGFIVKEGAVYITNFTTGKLEKFDGMTLVKDAEYAGDSIFPAYYMDMDDAGNVIYYKWLAGGKGMEPYYYTWGAELTTDVNPKAMGRQEIGARIDMPAAHGNFTTGKGRIYAMPNASTNLLRHNYEDGVWKSTDTIVLAISAGGINTVAELDENNVFVTLRGADVLHVDLTTKEATSVVAGTSIYKSTHGAKAFKFGGKSFLVHGAGTTYFGDMVVVDVTDIKAPKDVYVRGETLGTAATGTSCITFRTVEKDGAMYIYEYAANGLALYKMTMEVDLDKVEFAEKTAEVKVGRDLELKATVTPEDAYDKTLVWKSMDEAIATVADGKVRGVAAGTVKIAVTSKVKETLTDTCVVTVSEVAPITIAEFIAAAETEYVNTLKDVQVTYANGQNLFVTDGTASILIFNSDKATNYEYANGTILKGVQGKYEEYFGQAELVSPVIGETAEGDAVAPKVLTAMPTDANINEFVKVEKVTVVKDGRDFKVQISETELLPLYNKFKLETFEFAEDKKYDIEGLIIPFKGAPQLNVTKYEEVVVEDGLANLYLEGVRYANATIYNANGLQLSVYNANGMLVATGNGNIDMSAYSAGLYIVRSDNAMMKIVK